MLIATNGEDEFSLTLLRFCFANELAHELGGELRVHIGKLDSYCLAIHNRQLVAQLVADIALITNPAHRLDEIMIVLACFAFDDAVVALKAAYAAISQPLEFAAEMRQDLQRADSASSLVH
jgi:hypothetical protein